MAKKNEGVVLDKVRESAQIDELPVREQPNYRFEKERQADARLVKGVFQDNELAGGQVDFFFKKYKGDPIKRYVLKDGETYELPLGVVKHLNSNCAYQSHHYLLGPDGKPTKSAKKTHRFSFKVAEYT